MSATADLLALSQWLSPSFPVSAYAYSHGLEAEIVAGRVQGGAGLERWIGAVLQRGAGWSDGVLLAHGMRPETDLEALADLARALASSRERWEETRDQGAALAETLGALGLRDLPRAAYPVTLGAALRGRAVAPGQAVALYLQGFAANLVSCAVRFMPLGQAEGQHVLARLRPVVEQVAEAASRAGLDQIGQAAFGADLAAIEHEALEVRIFRT